MDKEEIIQTIILSFVVSIIILFAESMRSLTLSIFDPKYYPILDYFWMIIVLFFASLIFVIISRVPKIMKIEKKEIIKFLEWIADILFLIFYIMVSFFVQPNFLTLLGQNTPTFYYIGVWILFVILILVLALTRRDTLEKLRNRK